MKKRTKAAIISGIVIALLAAGLWGGNLAVRHRIERALADAHLGNFLFTYGDMQVDLLRKSITLNEIELRTAPRHIPVDSLLPTPIQFLDGRIERVFLSGISLKKLKNGEYDFGRLVIDSPHITVVTHPVAADSSVTKKPLPPIGIDRIQILNGKLDWRQIVKSDTIQLKIVGLGVGFTSFHSISGQNILQGKNSSIDIDSVRYTFGNQSYTLAMDSIELNSMQYLSISKLALIPHFSKYDFPRKSVRKSDYMALEAQGLTVTGLQLDRFLAEKRLVIDSIYLSSGQLTSAKDRNAAVPVREKPMLHTMLQRIPIPLEIKKIRVDDFTATYEETALHRTSPGRVTFEHIEATVDSLTNIARHTAQSIDIQANASLMGVGKIHARIALPVDPQNDRFDIVATLQKTPLEALNSMILPLASLEIRSGTVEQMDFRLTGGSMTANAEMTLIYNDLRIELLRQGRGGWRERQGLSNLANWALIQPDNPDRHGLRNTQVIVHRDPHRSVFNYLWKGVSATALETVETGLARRLMKQQAQ